MAGETIIVGRADAADDRPYAPGWLWRLTAWIHSRSWPAWLTYLALAAASVAVSNSQNWLSGRPLGEISPTQTAWGLVTVGFLVAVDYLDGLAGNAFDQFRVALSPGRIDEATARYELTTEPRRVSLIILVLSFPLTFAYYVADPVASQVAGLSPAGLVVRGAFESIFSAIVLTIVVRAVRQLRLVSRLHDLADRVDPFHPAPLHAFSRLTSQTGVALVAFTALGVMLNPAALSNESAVLWTPWLIGFPLVSVIVFVTPLLGMHRRLAAVKADLQAAAEDRLKAVLAALNADVDALELGRADALQKTLTSVVQERDILAKLPTWPWSAGTFRGFVTAILLPLAIFVVQRFLVQLV